MYTGVANDKNGLGYDCLLFGLGALWCFLEAVREKAGRYRNRQLMAHGTILLMVAWLFWKANSATSMIGFLLGATIFLLVAWIRRPIVVHVLAVAIPVAAVVAFVILDLDAYAASAVGRDVSLTGRTELWAEALRVHNAPLFGVGFEAYWLGPRADYLWQKFWWRPNQAHNGYLETYLTLGWMGLVMLALMLASGYRHIVQILRRDPDVASFLVGLFAAVLVYNLTEAAFKGIHPLWIAALLAVTTVPTLPLRESAPAGSTQPVRSKLTVFNTEWASARSRNTDGEKTARLPGVRARTSH